MITMTSKKDRAFCVVECTNCFQNIVFKLKGQGNYTECPYCTEEIPPLQSLIERTMARIAYFYSEEGDNSYD